MRKINSARMHDEIKAFVEDAIKEIERRYPITITRIELDLARPEERDADPSEPPAFSGHFNMSYSTRPREYAPNHAGDPYCYPIKFQLVSGVDSSSTLFQPGTVTFPVSVVD